MKSPFIPLVLLAACATDPATDDDALVDDSSGGKADIGDQARVFYCRNAGASVKVRLSPSDDSFDVEAISGGKQLFALAAQRPSLNVVVDTEPAAEFIDFRPRGLDVVPAIATPRLELPLATGNKRMVFSDGTTNLELDCTVSASKLLAYLGIAPQRDLGVDRAHVVGFDIDDTLLFSTPSFGRAFATGGTPAPGDTVFWTQANGCDPGCDASTLTLPDGTTKALPANLPSPAKQAARELVEYHLERGAEVYAITARPDINGDVLRNYIESELGIPADHVFFEPDLDQPGNPAGKTDRMQALGLDVFYGDADSDITDAKKANVRGIRFQRSPKSSNRKDGRLAKYHPGYFGETIVANSRD